MNSVYIAADKNNLAMVELLITNKGENKRNNWFGSPLHHAVQHKNHEMIKKIFKHGGVKTIECLWLQKTPLYSAMLNSDLWTAKILIFLEAQITNEILNLVSSDRTIRGLIQYPHKVKGICNNDELQEFYDIKCGGAHDNDKFSKFENYLDFNFHYDKSHD
jgi:hypothetical protein